MNSLLEGLRPIIAPEKKIKFYNESIIMVPFIAFIFILVPFIIISISSNFVVNLLGLIAAAIIIITYRILISLPDPKVKNGFLSVLLNSIFFEFKYGWFWSKEYQKSINVNRRRNAELYVKGMTFQLIIIIVFSIEIISLFSNINIDVSLVLRIISGYVEYSILMPLFGAAAFEIFNIIDTERKIIEFEILEIKQQKDTKIWKEARQRLHLTTELSVVISQYLLKKKEK